MRSMQEAGRSIARRLAAAVLALAATACGGDGGTGPDPDPPPTVAADTLAGRAADPAVEAVSRQLFTTDGSDLRTGHPQAPGAELSVSTVMVVLAADAQVGTVNALVRQLGARLVGGIPGRAGRTPAIVVLRLATSTHEAMDQALATLRASPAVRAAVQDAALRPAVVTYLPSVIPNVPWEWDVAGDPAFATWGLAALRVPQLWNLNARLRAERAARGAAPVVVGVLDNGFASDHEDLQGVLELENVNVRRMHGTAVASVIGANVGNRLGTDGVSPFVRLVGWSIALSQSAFAFKLYDLLSARSDLAVVNVSLGYQWADRNPPLSSRTQPYPQRVAREAGETMRAILENVAANQPLPFIVAAAGNESDTFADTPAEFASPMNYAALALGVAAITVVEADDGTADRLGVSFRKADFSNVGGHLSAPGVGIGAADSVRNAYRRIDGTSFSAPLVAGAAAYLYALLPPGAVDAWRPTLATNPMRDLLIATRHRSADRNGRPQADAFAAALGLDVVLGGDQVLRRLLDVDDGTLDGNRRIDQANGAVVTSDDPLADGGPGAMRIDMADFRRWRDWLLQLEDAAGLRLDGAPDHPKKDPNGDGNVIAGSAGLGLESQFPRGDFNGDGELSRTAVAEMPGVLASLGPLTDLEVLQARFEDPDYPASVLPDLINSGDLDVSASQCFLRPGAATVRSQVFRGGATTPIGARNHVVAQPARPYTLATGTVTVRAEAFDASGASVGRQDTTVALRLGEDVRWAPTCGTGPGVEISPATVTVQPDEAVTFTARVVGLPDTRVTWEGALEIAPNQAVIRPAVGGAVLRVTARSVADPARSATATVTVTDPPRRYGLQRGRMTVVEVVNGQTTRNFTEDFMVFGSTVTDGRRARLQMGRFGGTPGATAVDICGRLGDDFLLFRPSSDVSVYGLTDSCSPTWRVGDTSLVLEDAPREGLTTVWTTDLSPASGRVVTATVRIAGTWQGNTYDYRRTVQFGEVVQ